MSLYERALELMEDVQPPCYCRSYAGYLAGYYIITIKKCEVVAWSLDCLLCPRTDCILKLTTSCK